MNIRKLKTLLIHINACEEAIEWAKDKDLETAWNICHRGDWMIWLLINSKNKVTDKELRLIAINCAREVQHLMKDQRSIDALDVAERFTNGDATCEELAAARGAVRNIAWAAAVAKQAQIVRSIVPEIKLTGYA